MEKAEHPKSVYYKACSSVSFEDMFGTLQLIARK